MGARAILIGVIALVAGAALIGARQPVHSNEAVTIGAPSAGSEQVSTSSPRPEPAKPRAAKTTTAAARNITNAKPAPAIAPAKSADAKPASTSTDPSVPASGTAPKADIQSVTITGCVVADDDTFWLSDTSGADAPKSRSWKSGFLKKSRPRIELVDANHTLRLSRYAGQRVAATGMLVDREMRARSMQRVAGSCN